jgi:putative Mg2+ transporter-C (MgtC) family protein
MRILEVEKPVGVVVAFGGQTAIKLTQALDKAGVKILGTSAEGIDIAEDRERFDALLERFSIRRPKGAGVRTHAMVCMGAAMTMIISQYIKVRFPEMQGDVFRLGAAVISGIGFLGAGTIIVGDRNRIHGLTTAAGLWTCACIGLAAGAGFIEGTLVAMLAAYLILHNLTALDVRLRKQSRVFDLYIEFVDIDAVHDFLHELDVRGIKYSELVTQESPISGEGVVSTLSVELHSYNEKKTFLRNMKEYEGITYFELA